MVFMDICIFVIFSLNKSGFIFSYKLLLVFVFKYTLIKFNNTVIKSKLLLFNAVEKIVENSIFYFKNVN